MEIVNIESPDPEPPDKKLSARAVRRKENKGTNEFVIKCGLNNFVKKSFKSKKDLLNEINQRAIWNSKAFHSVGVLVTIFLHECIDKATNPWEIIIPKDLFDSNNCTFVNQIINGLKSTTRKNIPEVIELFKNYRNVLPRDTTRKYIGNTNSLVSSASQYVTNFKTYLQEEFDKKQLFFLHIWCKRKGFDDEYVKKLRYLINGWDLEEKEDDNTIITDGMFYLVMMHRKILGFENFYDSVCDVWKKDNYDKIVIYFSVLSKFLVKNGKKSILLAPLPKIKTSFLYIDASVFSGILKDINYVKTADLVKKDPFSFYNKVFNVDKLLTPRQKADGFKFTGTIQTDSVSVCFHFRRPDLPKSSTTPEEIDRNDPNVRVIGQDPGRTILFYGVEELDDGTFKKYKLSRNQFYTDSGIKEANINTNKWNKTYLKSVLEQLSQTNSRSNYLEDFLKYVKIVRDNYDILWRERTRQRYARQRFSLYSGKRSVYDKFFYNIKQAGDPEKKIVIAYGDAKFSSTFAHEIPAPTTSLEKRCAKWFKVVKVCEFRTTQLHCETGEILSKIVEKTTTFNTKTNKTEYSKNQVRGLLWFNSTKGGKFIDRDFNAAKNILKCYRLYPNRPPGMDRNDPKQKVPKVHFIYKERRIEVVKVSEDLGIWHLALAWTEDFLGKIWSVTRQNTLF